MDLDVRKGSSSIRSQSDLLSCGSQLSCAMCYHSSCAALLPGGLFSSFACLFTDEDTSDSYSLHHSIGVERPSIKGDEGF